MPLGCAEQIRVPTENAIPLGPVNPAEVDRWCALNTLLVPYSGLLAPNLQAGETLLISGATGNFGSSGIAIALAVGADHVIAPGRNESVLADLAYRYYLRLDYRYPSGSVDRLHEFNYIVIEVQNETATPANTGYVERFADEFNSPADQDGQCFIDMVNI